MTFDIARAAVTGEKLGEDEITDMLTVSLSSPDYIGHAYGPNSVEAEDGFLRLDKDLGDFISFLDEKVGKGEYLLFLSADHGVANVPAFLKEHQIPAGNFANEKITTELNSLLKGKTQKVILSLVSSITRFTWTEGNNWQQLSKRIPLITG